MYVSEKFKYYLSNYNDMLHLFGITNVCEIKESLQLPLPTGFAYLDCWVMYTAPGQI